MCTPGVETWKWTIFTKSELQEDRPVPIQIRLIFTWMVKYWSNFPHFRVSFYHTYKHTHTHTQRHTNNVISIKLSIIYQKRNKIEWKSISINDPSIMLFMPFVDMRRRHTYTYLSVNLHYMSLIANWKRMCVCVLCRTTLNDWRR